MPNLATVMFLQIGCLYWERLSRPQALLYFFFRYSDSKLKLEWYEFRIFGPKLMRIFWLESLSSKYKTGQNAVLKKNVQIDLIRTLNFLLIIVNSIEPKMFQKFF